MNKSYNVKLNINNTIRFKITPEGYKYLEECGNKRRYVVDKDGYSEGQLWDVMYVFGPQMMLGRTLPIEIDIFIHVESGMIRAVKVGEL